MRKFLILAAAATMAATTAQAASLSSAECSSSQIKLTFDGNVSASEVTALKIGEGSNPRLKYELALNGTASGSTITYTVDSTALNIMGKVAPHKAYMFAEGTSSGNADCE